MYVGRARSTVEFHNRDGEASCSTRTTTQRFYRPMPLPSLYLVLSLCSSSFSLDRQLCADTSIACARLRIFLRNLYCLTLPYLSDTFFDAYRRINMAFYNAFVPEIIHQVEYNMCTLNCSKWTEINSILHRK